MDICESVHKGKKVNTSDISREGVCMKWYEYWQGVM